MRNFINFRFISYKFFIKLSSIVFLFLFYFCFVSYFLFFIFHLFLVLFCMQVQNRINIERERKRESNDGGDVFIFSLSLFLHLCCFLSLSLVFTRFLRVAATCIINSSYFSHSYDLMISLYIYIHITSICIYINAYSSSIS